MSEPTIEGDDVPSTLTATSLLNRSRIVGSASRLFYVKGVNGTTVEDVCAASGTSKSQLYSVFRSKTDLVHAVIDLQSQRLLAREEQRLRGVRTFGGLRRWRDALVQIHFMHDEYYGCALGKMSVEMSGNDEESRRALAKTFQAWQRILVQTPERLRDLGVLDQACDVETFGVGLLAALQGGQLLARTTRDAEPILVALDMALARIESFAK